jgi:hypothetical protein
MSEILLQKTKKEISFDTSSSQTKAKPSFENSRHAPFLFFSLKTNNRHLSQKQMESHGQNPWSPGQRHVGRHSGHTMAHSSSRSNRGVSCCRNENHSCWRPLSAKEGGANASTKKKSYFFLGASAGFSGAGAGAGVAAGAGGAGASAGFISSLGAGFGASLALHPIPIEAILITKTSARKRKIHFFM